MFSEDITLPLFYLYVRCSMSVFASFSRGQPPARHTKVVDNNLRPLKSQVLYTCLSVPVCATNNCVVCDCGSVRCKTCKHKYQGSTYFIVGIMTSEGGSSGASQRDSASPPIVRDGTSLPTTASFQVTIPEPFTFSRPEEWVKWTRRFEYRSGCCS